MITTTEIKVQYTPSVSQNSFVFSIPYFESTDINVTIVDSLGNSSELTLDAISDGFSVEAVNGIPNNGATITTTETYTSGDIVTISRIVPVTQETEFLRGGDIPPELLNVGLDRVTAATQQVIDQSGRSIIGPITDDEAINYVLPTVELRKNKVIGFDDDGNTIAIDVGAGGGLIGVDTSKGLVSTNGIVSVKVDGSSIVFDGSGNLDIGTVVEADIGDNEVTTAKIRNANVTYDKLALIADRKIIGNISGDVDHPQGTINFLDEDSMASNDPDAIASQQSIKAYVDAAVGAFSGIQEYESAEQTVPSQDTDLEVTHGLGGIPKWSQLVLRCTTANNGYAIGDEIILSNDHGDAGFTYTTWQNATTLGFRRVTDNLYISDRDGTGQIDITDANWRMVFKAWK